MTFHATFVLSTGRCGTQWLARCFADAFGERLRVEHEPLHNRYHPELMLGVSDVSNLEPNIARPILAHFERIEGTLQSCDYFEAGHPSWSCLPCLARRFVGRIRVVHLVRHPVPTAFSWLSHGAFVPPILPNLPRKERITPFAAGTSFPEYRDCWETMTPFEKCLYYWAEVNALGLRLENQGDVPWLRLRFEDLFDVEGGGLRALLRFMRLPEAAADQMRLGEPIDRFHYTLAGWPDPSLIRRHPAIVTVAEKLGYHPDEYATGALRDRFGCGGLTGGGRNE